MGGVYLWAVVLGFVVGVFLASILPLGFSAAAFLVLLAVGIVALAYLDRQPKFLITVVFLAATSLGVARMQLAIVESDPALDALVGEKIVLEGAIFAEPDVREASVRLSLHADSMIYRTEPHAVEAGVLVVAPAHAEVRYGDRIRAEGTLRLPQRFETGEGREFDYPAYLAKDGILYELAFANVEKIGEGWKNPLKAAAIFIKQTYLKGIALALPEPHAGLAGGITAGDKRGLGTELSATFRTVSLTHIIVLSGYNIMIVVLGLGWLLQKVYAPRAWKLFFGISVAILFALITGLASASVRAAAMASIALLGQYTGRLYLASRALALVAALMVLWNPYVLVYDLGFQLSVVATWGLIALTPHIAPRLSFITTKGNLREIFATTLAAQLAVMPLLLYQSGAFPLYALPANLFALVVIPWAMLFSAIASLGGLILGPLAVVVAFPAYALLSYILGIAELFASLPFASLALPTFSAWWLVVFYAALLLFAYRKKNEQA